jgi:hypothetical protein
MLRIITNPVTIFSYSLGFVVAWFGMNELIYPHEWIAFAPSFLGDGVLAVDLVVAHGIILVACAVLLFFNFYRRIGASVLALIFLEILFNLIMQTGLSDIAVRDIGLCGMSIGLALVKPRSR